MGECCCVSHLLDWISAIMTSTGKHRKWMAKVPSDTIKIRELWEFEHENRRRVMQQRADVRSDKAAEERRIKAEQHARYVAMCKAARKHRIKQSRQHRAEVRFARTLEEERVNQRAIAGDTWVERRMCHTAELEKMAAGIKIEKAQLRQQEMQRRWDKMERDRQMRQQRNRVCMLEKLRPLTALGTDVAALIPTNLPSPMEQRMSAIAEIHAIRSRKQRNDMHVALARSKEKQRLSDLSCTRTTAENRAEQQWLLKLETKGLAAHGTILSPPPLGIPLYDDEDQGYAATSQGYEEQHDEDEDQGYAATAQGYDEQHDEDEDQGYAVTAQGYDEQQHYEQQEHEDEQPADSRAQEEHTQAYDQEDVNYEEPARAQSA